MQQAAPQPVFRQVRRPPRRALLLGLLLGVAAGVAAQQPAPDAPYERELTETVYDGELPEIGDSAGSVISPEQERQLGMATMRQVRRMAPLVTDEEVEDYIQKLGMELGKNANYYGDFHFFVIDSPVINVMATESVTIRTVPARPTLPRTHGRRRNMMTPRMVRMLGRYTPLNVPKP